MHYAVSDLHGIDPRDLDRLLEKAGFTRDDTLYVLGDVIDRGKWGVELLVKIMQMPNAEMIMGNHEGYLVACDFVFEELSEELLDSLDDEKFGLLLGWFRNGAENTINGLARLKEKDPALLWKLRLFVRTLPLYLEAECGGRRFLMTHSGLGNFDPQKRPEDYSADELIWTRPRLTDRYYEDVFTVFGHTPVGYLTGTQAGGAVITQTWADIDMGVSSGGTPMLFRLEDMHQIFLTQGEESEDPPFPEDV